MKNIFDRQTDKPGHINQNELNQLTEFTCTLFDFDISTEPR